MVRIGPPAKRLKTSYDNRFVSPSLAHRLLYPKYTMMRNKKQFLPYGMPFNDLQDLEDYEESVSRFSRLYRWATLDELILWGLESYASEKRKNGEPKTLSVSTENGKKAIRKYVNRLNDTLKECVIGDSEDASIIWTLNPTRQMYRANAYGKSFLNDRTENIKRGDTIFNVNFSNKTAKMVRDTTDWKNWTWEMKEQTQLTLGVHLDSTLYLARKKIKYRYEREQIINPQTGRTYTFNRRIPRDVAWYYAQTIESPSRHKIEAQRFIAEVENGENPNIPRHAISNGLQFERISFFPMSQPYGRNKAMFLVPYSILETINYGTINNEKTIADRYPFNPSYDWDSEKEEGDDDA